VSKPDYYAILGISRTATPAQIRAAHRTNARRYHPDTADDGRGDPHRFAQVQEAYEILSVADFRRRYDHKQAAERGEIPLPGKRRPPKAPCGACKTPVYASQLTLYLGRHLCAVCMDRKRTRESNRPRLSGFVELSWRLKRIGIWLQLHFAIIAVVLAGFGAIGARLAWVISHAHHGGESSDTQEVADVASENPVTSTSRADAPVASVAEERQGHAATK
jgi:hypothetical protein